MIADRLAMKFDQLDPNMADTFAHNGVVCPRGSVDPQVVVESHGWPEIAIQHPDPRYEYELRRPYSAVAFGNDPRDGNSLEGPAYPVLWPR